MDGIKARNCYLLRGLRELADVAQKNFMDDCIGRFEPTRHITLGTLGGGNAKRMVSSHALGRAWKALCYFGDAGWMRLAYTRLGGHGKPSVTLGMQYDGWMKLVHTRLGGLGKPSVTLGSLHIAFYKGEGRVWGN